jgi:hypothetical protein
MFASDGQTVPLEDDGRAEHVHDGAARWEVAELEPGSYWWVRVKGGRLRAIELIRVSSGLTSTVTKFDLSGRELPAVLADCAQHAEVPDALSAFLQEQAA